MGDRSWAIRRQPPEEARISIDPRRQKQGDRTRPSCRNNPFPPVQASSAGTVNTGGGGGGTNECNSETGGSGIVIIKAPSAATLAVSPGDNTTATTPAGKIATFTVSGTLTVS